MTRKLNPLLGVLVAQFILVASISAQSGPAATQAQDVLAAAASEHKFTFLVFYKDNGPATQAMAQSVKKGVGARDDRAKFAFVNVTNPAEKTLVDRFGVSRAPMPITVAVAPNGALTRLTPNSITDEQIEQSFVTPAMSRCMKSMQEGRLVFLCIQSGPQPKLPLGVANFINDPEFKDRVVVVPVSSTDRNEAELVRQLEADVAIKGATTVFLAPPGVLVGKFGATATKEHLAAALHKAGHCCDDPNCKHNQNPQSASPPNAAAARQPQAPAARR
jgi:hypothetical protein